MYITEVCECVWKAINRVIGNFIVNLKTALEELFDSKKCQRETGTRKKKYTPQKISTFNTH